MKAWERKLLDLENSLNSFRESNTKRLIRLESVGTENSRRISELEAKINTVDGNASENQRVILELLNNNEIQVFYLKCFFLCMTYTFLRMNLILTFLVKKVHVYTKYDSKNIFQI